MEYLRTIWETLVSCFNCQEGHSNQRHGEPNERTLLIDPRSQSQIVDQPHCDDFTREYPSSLPKTKEEQTALSRIVQETASNIIDVAAMDSHNLEPQEYTDRVKMYSQKLSQQWSNVRHPNVPGPKGLLADIPSEAVLRKPAFTQADLQMIKNFVQKAAIAVNDIRVEHKHDLIVPFRIQ